MLHSGLIATGVCMKEACVVGLPFWNCHGAFHSGYLCRLPAVQEPPHILPGKEWENMQRTLGIELGSTRIKAVIVDEAFRPLASGSHEWQNKLVDGVWTYSLADVWAGIQDCYGKLKASYVRQYGEKPVVDAIGVSAMMHGYLVFDSGWNQLAPFRTWRNTMTEQAAEQLSKLFDFNIPQRWSVAHLYQAMLNGEEHLKDIAHLTTLAGYVHFSLTGKNVLGVGEASGMFPIDSEKNDFNESMIKLFEERMTGYPCPKGLREKLPTVLVAGQQAGELTEEGAKRIDPSGDLKAGIPLCPPEGDAGTGMVATNSVAKRTGNVSAGTSIFAMVVLEKQLSRMYTEIDMVTTPAGQPVAMVHCNNFTSDIDAWMRLFKEVLGAFGIEKDNDAFYGTLYRKAMEKGAESAGMVSYNYFAGEPITATEEGRPLFARLPDSHFSLANFMRTILFSALGTLKLGMDILTQRERVTLDMITGHGGFFKTKGVGQNLMSSALGVPVTVLDSAGEGGAWGIALLAAYLLNKKDGDTLERFLDEQVFQSSKGTVVQPDQRESESFAKFMEQYQAGLAVERAAIDSLK